MRLQDVRLPHIWELNRSTSLQTDHCCLSLSRAVASCSCFQLYCFVTERQACSKSWLVSPLFCGLARIRQIFKGRVSRFDECASDDWALSSSLLLDQLEASTQHRQDIIACWLDIYNLIGQCFGHVSERNKKAAHIQHEGIFATLRLTTFKKMPEPLPI